MTAPQDPFTPPPADRTPGSEPFGGGSAPAGSSRIGGDQPAADPFGSPSTPSVGSASIGSAPIGSATPGAGAPPYGDGVQQPPGYPQAPPPPAYGTGYAQSPGAGYGGKPSNGMGIAALVLGVLSLLLALILGIGILFAIPAIILGFLGRGKAKRGEATNGGVALGGIITGLLGLLLSGLVLAGVAAFFGSDTAQQLIDCTERAGGDQAAIERCRVEFTR